MALASRSGSSRIDIRQAFTLTTASWVALTAFAALPFAFSELDLSYTDAFFEAMSGVTTTGSTVITGLDRAPPGILLWRGILQWLGGIGTIVMAVAVMPVLRVGGMQLFRMESTDHSEKALPRAAQVATAIGGLYVVLSLIWAIAYWMAGMNGLEAVVHAMTTLSTGGFSTADASLAHFDSPAIDVIATVGMIAGAMPFIAYLRVARGDRGAVIQDSQVPLFLGTAACFTLIAAGWLWLDSGQPPLTALRLAAVNVVSMMTGTGYTSASFDSWGSFAMPLFLVLMMIGGCAGSTTGAIKIFRFQVLYAAARSQMHHLLQPHGVFIPYYNRRPITDEVILSVLGFFFLFGMSLALIALGLGMLGLDFVTALSGATAALTNVGPGLGPLIGPAGSYHALPDAAKWLLAAGMLLGRLELFTVLVMLTRGFWRG
jgi:trk system potassium uptake protein TrkH